MADTGKIVRGEGLHKDLTSNTLFDKVINLKFFREHDGKGNMNNPKTFTIRSDYEMVLTASGGYKIEKCKIKPSIRVEYRQVAGPVAIQVMIYVSNFHIYMNGSDKRESYNSANNPIKRIVIQMGYLRQFADMSRWREQNLTLDDYFDLTEYGKYPDSVMTMDASVLAVYPVSNPPDNETCFECKIGLLEMGLHPATEVTLKDGVSLEEFLYEAITLRYPRKPIEPADEGKVSYSTMKNNKAIRDKYGTKIILSDNAKKAVSKPETPWHIPEHFTNPNAAMEYITKNLIPGLIFFPLTDGNYIGYLSAVDRSVSDVMYSADVEKAVGDEKVFLPAVYSISYGGTRMVKCMFFKELKPFKKINFSTDFNMANRIGYFYSPGTASTGMDFTPVNLVVRFATTEDLNIVEMTSVDDDSKK